MNIFICQELVNFNPMKYKITIEYDGSGLVGWQKQPDQPNKSVEELVENAILAMTLQKVKLNCAGRTDAGVHALGQVADFSLSQPQGKEFSERQIIMGVNRFLSGHRIAIIDCQIVDESFHSRYDALSRTYHYRIVNRTGRLALDTGRAWHIGLPLNVDLMNEAAQHLIGLHDFSSFRDSKCQSNTPIRRVVNLFSNTHGRNTLILEIEAKSFLHHMVRNIVGTLVDVGLGRTSPQEVLDILQAKDRTKSGQNAPACGLYFSEVKYYLD